MARKFWGKTRGAYRVAITGGEECGGFKARIVIFGILKGGLTIA